MIDLLAPYEIPSQNERDKQHWSKHSRESKKWTAFFRFTKRPGGMDDADIITPLKRKVSITAYRRQRCKDIANLIGGAKAMIDGLVRANLLVDDSEDWAVFTYAQDVASKSPTKKPCTRIIIENISS